MRWLVVHPGPSFSVQDTYTGWVEALGDLGEQVIPFNLDERLTLFDNAYLRMSEKLMRKALTGDQAILLSVDGLYSTLYRMHPDVLFVISGFLIPHELLDLARFRGTKVVVMHTEEPYELTRELATAEHADLNLINDPVHIDRFRAVAPTGYMPHAYRPAVHYSGAADPDLACDFTFIGTAFESRIQFFEAMQAAGGFDGLDVLLGGNWQQLDEESLLRKYLGHDISACMDNSETARVYRSARAGLNLYRREADDGDTPDGWAMGPREVEQAACGLFFLRDPRGEGDELFPMLPTFDGPEDAGEILRWWLDHEDQRRDAARRAREAVAERTFKHSAVSLLRLLEKE
jgi:spore maturation protein CgeB